MRTAKSSEPVARCAHVAGARKQAQLSTEMKRGNALRMGFIVADCPRRKGKKELPVAEVSYNYDAVDAPQATRRNALRDQKRRKTASIVTHAAIARRFASRAGLNFQPRTVFAARSSNPKPTPPVTRISATYPSSPTSTHKAHVPCTFPVLPSSV